MLQKITRDFLESIENPAFREYARMYLAREDDFSEQIAAFGLPQADGDYLTRESSIVQDLESRGLCVENNAKSLRMGWLSPSCVACRRGVGTKTYLISVQCPKDCYYCFNPNQVDYDHLLTHTHDVKGELMSDREQGYALSDIALTGGEPLLHRTETLEFFREARSGNPASYLRLYTSGVGLDEAYLTELRDAGLDEIRFSIKMEADEKEIEEALRLIALSVPFIPHIVIEMPVFPDNLEHMKRLLDQLDALGIDGINLLEFCYPLTEPDEFLKRGYALKPVLYDVLYNYWYAGGLPVAGSEENCLLLLEYALEAKFSLGVHYCSLENKFTGQIYQANVWFRISFERMTFSEKDYFLKSAKVFGGDVSLVKAFLQSRGLTVFHGDEEHASLEFPLSYLEEMEETFPFLEVGICYHVAEPYEGQVALKELRVDYTTPESFCIDEDI